MGGVETELHGFLTSALDGSEFHAPAALPPGKDDLEPTA